MQESLRPNAAVLVGGSGAIVIVSVLMLPWPAAVASAVLGALMIAGADVDARTLLLPDVVTWGAVGCGIIAAAALDPDDPWLATASAPKKEIRNPLRHQRTLTITKGNTPPSILIIHCLDCRRRDYRRIRAAESKCELAALTELAPMLIFSQRAYRNKKAATAPGKETLRKALSSSSPASRRADGRA